ncbi:hypothetical protein J2Z40_000844 [Cytobacillus eiseniae]|uniref:DUF2642 domain-containing protein n=1 Tax=Cytobacillus eiseniae TaxID=762947 RepID=A0ABS4RBL8_9BACI|nr:hypothetical protein [Cytobacillus eiseniae]MBP2240291.1 hypothetical protein [Cytobacillus eiseniae]
MFADLLVDQLRNYTGVIVEVAVADGLFEGIIRSVTAGVIEFTEIITGYEQQTRPVVIPLSSVSFIRVPI